MGNTKSSSSHSHSEKQERPSKKNSSSERIDKTGSRSARSSISGGCKKSLLTASQRGIIKYCLENAKDDLSERIMRRVSERKDDFHCFIEGLPKEHRCELTDGLKDFLRSICDNLLDADSVQKESANYGGKHVALRAFCFKPDFFAGLADAVTTECTFLDGATHPPSETAAAWSELSSFVFSAVRDGYYAELRRQRKNSSAFRNRSSVEKSSSTEGSKDDDPSRRSASPCPAEEVKELNTENEVKDSSNFLLPPTVY